MRHTPFIALATALIISSAAAMPTDTTFQGPAESPSTPEGYEEVDLILEDPHDHNLKSRDIWGPKHLRVETFTSPTCSEEPPDKEIQHKDMKPGRCHTGFKPFAAVKIGRDQKLSKWGHCLLKGYITGGCFDGMYGTAAPMELDVLNADYLGRCVVFQTPTGQPINAMKVLCKQEHTGGKPKKSNGWTGPGWDGSGDNWDPKDGGY